MLSTASHQFILHLLIIENLRKAYRLDIDPDGHLGYRSRQSAKASSAQLPLPEERLLILDILKAWNRSKSVQTGSCDACEEVDKKHVLMSHGHTLPLGLFIFGRSFRGLSRRYSSSVNISCSSILNSTCGCSIGTTVLPDLLRPARARNVAAKMACVLCTNHRSLQIDGTERLKPFQICHSRAGLQFTGIFITANLSIGCRIFSLLNSFGLYNKNAKILFLVCPCFWLEQVWNYLEGKHAKCFISTENC